MKKLLVLLLLPLFIGQVFAGERDQVVIDAGLGIFGTEGPSLSQVKFAKIGIEEDLWYALKQKFNGGGWLDSRGYGRSSSAFAGYQLGFEVENSLFEGSVWSGPTLISSPDIALGGYFQFNETVFFGIKDDRQESIGFAYNHFSCASLCAPNLGRDFMGLEIKFPF